jgi:hypothetical protein
VSKKANRVDSMKAATGEADLLARPLGVLSLVSLVLTVLWLVCFIAGSASAEHVDTFDGVLSHLANLDLLFYMTYLNAALLTVSVVMLFVVLFFSLKPVAPLWSTMGAAFVPIYGCLNLVAYLSQVTVVPRLLRLHAVAKYQVLSELLLQQTIQQWPDSAVFIFNNLAYAVLGVPSVIFGTLILKSHRPARLGGILLGLSGVACIAGFVGIVAEASWLAKGFLVGGILFLFTLAQFSWALLWNRL